MELKIVHKILQNCTFLTNKNKSTWNGLANQTGWIILIQIIEEREKRAFHVSLSAFKFVIREIRWKIKVFFFFFLVKLGSIKDTYLTFGWGYMGKSYPGHSNELKSIAHIRVASGIRIRVHRIGFILSNATGLPPLVKHKSFFPFC